MLRAVLADFAVWGRANITTSCDRRLGNISLAADCVISLAPSDYYSALADLAKKSTAALIIAPETDGILERLTAMIESCGIHVLGSSAGGVAIAADKWKCHQLLTEAGLPTPKTILTSLTEAVNSADTIGYPLVIKPVDGIGCEGVNFIKNSAALQRGLQSYKYNENMLLAQQYIEGQHLSISLLVGRKNITFLSANKQKIEVGVPFNYRGCEVPFLCEDQEIAVSLAKQVVSLIPGLQGYVGVDMVLSENGLKVIEINPRVTTSYIGLRQVSSINLAEAIWGAAMSETVPTQYQGPGKVTINKEGFV